MRRTRRANERSHAAPPVRSTSDQVAVSGAITGTSHATSALTRSTLAPRRRTAHATRGPSENAATSPSTSRLAPRRGGEDHGDHQQRRNVQRGRSVHQSERALDSHAAAPQRAGNRRDAGRTEVEHGAETDALQNAPPTPGSSGGGSVPCTCGHVGYEECLGNGGSRKRKQHPDGNELQVGHGESPPTIEETTPFARPVGVLDAEPLKTLSSWGRARRAGPRAPYPAWGAGSAPRTAPE